MNTSIITKTLALLLLATFVAACHHTKEESSTPTPKTPVTVIAVMRDAISETITLNATSNFLRKHTIKTFVAGYVKDVEVVTGQQVKKGQALFRLTTKEAAAYNSLNIKDTSFIRPKDIVITATSDGIVSTMAHQSGEYAQEGDELCTIAEPKSMVFLLDVPYELHGYAGINNKCIVKLPDGRELDASVSALMPKVDEQAQTQKVIIKANTAIAVPENLVVTIVLIKSVKNDAVILPKEAVLTNETQTEYWIMKMLNDSTAIKTRVKLGLRNLDKVEVLAPPLTTQDRVLISGNYGLSDTARVNVIQAQ